MEWINLVLKSLGISILTVIVTYTDGTTQQIEADNCSIVNEGSFAHEISRYHCWSNSKKGVVAFLNPSQVRSLEYK